MPLIFLTTCKKHHPGNGTTPENTDFDYFECKINGVQWSGPLSSLHLNYYCACDSILSITAYRGDDQQQLLLVSDQVVLGDTGNVIAGSGGVLYGEFGNSDPCSSSHYYTYRNGKVCLQEHNTTKQYLKGTFWIYGRSPNCVTDSVMEITEGQFLVHY